MNAARRKGRPVAAGLDLGSTFVKAGLLDDDGRLSHIESLPAPALTGTGLIREGDAAEYLEVARQVLSRTLEDAPRDIPLGIASQRSTFLLWDRESGDARTSMISWQDRRAADWCATHAVLEEEVRTITGLVLSAHYAGPKLAMLIAERRDLRSEVEAGHLLFGNLDAWALANWTTSRPHETDLTMAARTAMLDLSTADWSDSLLTAYGIGRELLPTVRPTNGRCIEILDGTRVTATISDQAAGVLGALGDATDAVLMTLGTGGFVLRPIERTEARPGYLTAPVLGSSGGVARVVLEGSVNGVAAALDAGPEATSPAGGLDPAPSAFCIPDSAGLGSPFWRPKIGLRFSKAANDLNSHDRARVVVEGVLFRLRQILEDLSREDDSAGGRPRILLSGGVIERRGIAGGLASVLERPVEILVEREAGLVGAARLALDRIPRNRSETRTVGPNVDGAYLAEKYERWLRWMRAELDQEG